MLTSSSLPLRWRPSMAEPPPPAPTSHSNPAFKPRPSPSHLAPLIALPLLFRLPQTTPPESPQAARISPPNSATGRRPFSSIPVNSGVPAPSLHSLSLSLSLAHLFDKVRHFFAHRSDVGIIDRRRPPPAPTPASDWSRTRAPGHRRLRHHARLDPLHAGVSFSPSLSLSLRRNARRRRRPPRRLGFRPTAPLNIGWVAVGR